LSNGVTLCGSLNVIERCRIDEKKCTSYRDTFGYVEQRRDGDFKRKKKSSASKHKW